MFRKANPVKDRAGYDEYLRTHPYCQMCWTRKPKWPGFSRHHIIKPGRSDEHCNLLVACPVCHDLAEGRRIRVEGELLPTLTLGVCLTIKKQADPALWNPDRLAELRHRSLPELEPIPLYLLRCRLRNR